MRVRSTRITPFPVLLPSPNLGEGPGVGVYLMHESP